jgi:hypothetical protein
MRAGKEMRRGEMEVTMGVFILEVRNKKAGR